MKNKNIKANPNTKGLIVKKNPLINARYKLSLYELRIFNFLISEIGRNDNDIKERKMIISEIVKECNIDSGNMYRDIQKALVRLQSRVIEIEDNEEWKMFSIFHKATMKKNKKGDYKNEVLFKLSDEIKPYLLDLKNNFSVSEYSFSRKLNSNYAVRFYEISLEYLRKNTICIYVLSVSKIKYMFRIEGKFARFDNFKARVLNPAKKEINEKTNLNFNFEVIPSDNNKSKIEKIKFIVSRKNEKKELVKKIDEEKIEVNILDEEEQELFNQVVAYGITHKKAKEIIESYPFNQITEALEVVKIDLKNPNKKINNVAGYVVTAIKEGYQKPIELKQQELKEKIHHLNLKLERFKEDKKSLENNSNKNKLLIIKDIFLKQDNILIDKYVNEMINFNTNHYKFALNFDSKIKDYSSKELITKNPPIFTCYISSMLYKYADENNIEVDEDQEVENKISHIDDLFFKTESEIKLLKDVQSKL